MGKKSRGVSPFFSWESGAQGQEAVWELWTEPSQGALWPGRRRKMASLDLILGCILGFPAKDQHSNPDIVSCPNPSPIPEGC